ncbi:hypothetical protein ZHAS_00009864 [Anopheles sinensis]|uniref:Uncharacterized protein n=1 Tax=Anopheles sinensis TaxID=74873 RepID=A0A084VW49_ANOSI|nr:hypothetical protein ZHAS_00009864 [Anopheles sinensis]
MHTHGRVQWPTPEGTTTHVRRRRCLFDYAYIVTQCKSASAEWHGEEGGKGRVGGLKSDQIELRYLTAAGTGLH